MTELCPHLLCRALLDQGACYSYIVAGQQPFFQFLGALGDEEVIGFDAGMEPQMVACPKSIPKSNKSWLRQQCVHIICLELFFLQDLCPLLDRLDAQTARSYSWSVLGLDCSFLAFAHHLHMDLWKLRHPHYSVVCEVGPSIAPSPLHHNYHITHTHSQCHRARRGCHIQNTEWIQPVSSLDAVDLSP